MDAKDSLVSIMIPYEGRETVSKLVQFANEAPYRIDLHVSPYTCDARSILQLLSLLRSLKSKKMELMAKNVSDSQFISDLQSHGLLNPS